MHTWDTFSMTVHLLQANAIALIQPRSIFVRDKASIRNIITGASLVITDSHAENNESMVFINDVQYFESPAIGCTVHHKIVTPDVVLTLWPKPDA